MANITEPAAFGSFLGDRGVVVRSGHGSSVCLKHEDGSVRLAGGWGGRVGDQGSGLWLGRKALLAATRCIDGMASSDEHQFVAKLVQIERVSYPISLVERMEDAMGHEPGFGIRKHLTMIGHLTVNIASKGDVFAQDLVRRSQVHLIEAVRCVISQSDDPNGIWPVTLRGSLFEALLHG